MRKGGGKSKGAAFERLVCQQLSLWVSKGKRKDLYWRSAMSGGRATLGKKKGEDLSHQAGDICAVHAAGHILTDDYFIECKFVRTLQLDRLIFGKGALGKFWDIACTQADSHDRIPMIIAKQNHGETLVVMPTRALLHHVKITATELYVSHSKMTPVVIVKLNDLLKFEFRWSLCRKKAWRL